MVSDLTQAWVLRTEREPVEDWTDRMIGDGTKISVLRQEDDKRPGAVARFQCTEGRRGQGNRGRFQGRKLRYGKAKTLLDNCDAERVCGNL